MGTPSPLRAGVWGQEGMKEVIASFKAAASAVHRAYEGRGGSYRPRAHRARKAPARPGRGSRTVGGAGRRGRAGRRLGWVRARREALDQPAGRQLRERGLRRGCALECFRAAAAEIKGGRLRRTRARWMRRWYLPELAEDRQLEAEIARATEGLR